MMLFRKLFCHGPWFCVIAPAPKHDHRRNVVGLSYAHKPEY